MSNAGSGASSFPPNGILGLSQALTAPTITAFPSVTTISLAGQSMNGKWTLIRAPKKFGWQIQQGYGLSGAYLFPKGDELVMPRFRVEFWASNDYFLFRQQRKTLLKKPTVSQLSALLSGTANQATAQSYALGLDHPELKDMGVTAVVVGEINPTIQEEGGLWATEVEFIQFRPFVLPPKPPQSAIPDKPVQVEPAQSAQEVEAAKLTSELQALQGGSR